MKKLKLSALHSGERTRNVRCVEGLVAPQADQIPLSHPHNLHCPELQSLTRFAVYQYSWSVSLTFPCHGWEKRRRTSIRGIKVPRITNTTSCSVMLVDIFVLVLHFLEVYGQYICTERAYLVLKHLWFYCVHLGVLPVPRPHSVVGRWKNKNMLSWIFITDQVWYTKEEFTLLDTLVPVTLCIFWRWWHAHWNM
jgi:hypothetical protein